MHGDALGRAAEDHHQQRLSLRLGAALGGLQQGAGPEERQRLATELVAAAVVGLLHFLGGGPLDQFHQVGRHADRQLAAADHHHLRHRGGERQHQLETGSLAGPRAGFDAATERVHFGPHDVHPDAPPGQLRHLRGRRKPRHEDQVGGVLVADLLARRDQPLLQRLVADSRDVKAGAVVIELHRDVVAFVAQPDDDGADRFLARRRSRLGRLDAVGDAIAQQVLERRRHAVEHATVHLDRAAGDIQLDLLAGLLGSLPHHPVQPVRDAFELHHPRAQQVALQFAGLARLGDQVVFGGFHRPLQAALHSRHVVHRLGHHPRQFLHPSEPVELERIETGGILGLRQP